MFQVSVEKRANSCRSELVNWFLSNLSQRSGFQEHKFKSPQQGTSNSLWLCNQIHLRIIHHSELIIQLNGKFGLLSSNDSKLSIDSLNFSIYPQSPHATLAGQLNGNLASIVEEVNSQINTPVKFSIRSPRISGIEEILIEPVLKGDTI